MADNGKLTLPRSLSLNTLIMVAIPVTTVIISTVSQWALYNERIGNLSKTMDQINVHLAVTDGRVETLDRAETRTETKLDDLISEVQRQHASNLPGVQR